MPSTLTWIDYDSEELARVHRILALLKQRETLDELGIGNIRDSIADQLFPGTSTIQTRLRYCLFVAWMYRELEDRRISPERMANAEREYQLRLMDGLLEADDKAGIFGVVAGKRIKRLPSSVYWSGLGSWGIRRFEGSQEDYYRHLPELHRRRSSPASTDDGLAGGATDSAWHPELPEVPEGFPEQATLALTRDEAEFVRDCIAVRHERSLLAWLAFRQDARAPVVERPWEHPNLADATAEHRTLLNHGRLFASLMHGAARLYNLLLARLARREALVAEHEQGFEAWREDISLDELAAWSLDAFWTAVTGKGYNITVPARRFVATWYELVVSREAKLADDGEATRLIEQRERRLKRARSRFASQHALEQFGGRAGLRPLTYRWNVVRQLLDDLYRGLNGNGRA